MGSFCVLAAGVLGSLCVLATILAASFLGSLCVLATALLCSSPCSNLSLQQSLQQVFGLLCSNPCSKPFGQWAASVSLQQAFWVASVSLQQSSQQAFWAASVSVQRSFFAAVLAATFLCSSPCSRSLGSKPFFAAVLAASLLGSGQLLRPCSNHCSNPQALRAVASLCFLAATLAATLAASLLVSLCVLAAASVSLQ